MTAYYNEIDPYAAEWLRNLIKAGHIADGDVDERSIEDVRPNELRGYTQCHFFAGIGVWSYALRLAGWSDDRPVWTGSCPCQPFSAAGKGAGFTDERHLWPAFHHLIKECGPAVIIGEQVASKAVEPWVDLVHTDLEALGYAFGCIPFPSAGVGAPHIRDRTYWVADSNNTRLERRSGMSECANEFVVRAHGLVGGVADTSSDRREGTRQSREIEERRESRSEQTGQLSNGFERRSANGGVANSNMQYQSSARDGTRAEFASRTSAISGVADTINQRHERNSEIGRQTQRRIKHANSFDRIESARETNGQWRAADWLLCRDGKWRPVESSTQQMVNGIACAMGRLRTETEIKTKVINVSKNTEFSVEIMSALQQGISAETIWFTVGGCIGIQQTTILLAGLCEYQRNLGEIINGKTQGCARIDEIEVRKMFKLLESTRSSQRFQLSEQCAIKLRNVMSELSQISAFKEICQSVASFSGSPLAHGAASRMGRLRAYGNAINAEQAKIFIECLM